MGFWRALLGCDVKPLSPPKATVGDRYATPFTFHCEYSVLCSRCDARAWLGSFIVLPGYEFMRPTLPIDWVVLEGNPICSGHKVTVI